MHADTLYHRMLDQEKQIEEAKAEGKPAPVFPPLVHSIKQKTTAATKATLQQIEKPVSQLSPENQALFQKRIEGLNAEERELEERAFKAELETGREMASAYVSIMAKQDAEREQRKRDGNETIGDKFTAAFRFRPNYDKVQEEQAKQEKSKKEGGEEKST